MEHHCSHPVRGRCHGHSDSRIDDAGSRRLIPWSGALAHSAIHLKTATVAYSRRSRSVLPASGVVRTIRGPAGDPMVLPARAGVVCRAASWRSSPCGSRASGGRATSASRTWRSFSARERGVNDAQVSRVVDTTPTRSAHSHDTTVARVSSDIRSTSAPIGRPLPQGHMQLPTLHSTERG
jgi:hypothetical protein